MIEEKEIRFLCSDKARIPYVRSREEFRIHEPALGFVVAHDGPFNNDFDPELTNIGVAIFGMALDLKEEKGIVADIDISLASNKE